MIKLKRFNWISAAIFGIMGFCLAANQSLVSNISMALGANETQMGYMISSLYGGSLAAVLFIGELAQRIGKRRTAFVASAAVSVGLFTVLMGSGLASVIVGFFVYGVGIGGFESCVMSLTTDNNGENANRFMNFAQALFSTGAVLAPILLSKLLRADEYRLFYAVAAAWYTAVTVYWIADRALDDMALKGESGGGLSFFRLIKNKKMIVYMASMFIFIGAESAFTYWINSYFAGTGYPGYGAIALSVYWFASIFGRLAGTRFRSPSGLMPYCYFFAAAGCVLLLIISNPILKLAAVALIGIAFAPVYAGLALLAGTLFPEQSAAGFSLMIFSAGVGGVAFQPIIGALLVSGGVSGFYIVSSVCCVICGVLLLAVHRAQKAEPKQSA